MPARLPLYFLLAILPAAAAAAQPAHPVYVPPAEELPAPEDLPAPGEARPAPGEIEADLSFEDPALEPVEPPALLGVHVAPSRPPNCCHCTDRKFAAW